MITVTPWRGEPTKSRWENLESSAFLHLRLSVRGETNYICEAEFEHVDRSRVLLTKYVVRKDLRKSAGTGN